MISGKSIVVAKLPNAGLGNKLFVWARAMTFAHINHLPLYIIGLNRIHIGPFLRKERIKRFYFGQFKRNALSSCISYRKHILFKSNRIVEPEIKYYSTNEPTLFFFDKIPSWKDYFKSIHKYRELIKMEFKNILSEKVRKNLGLLQDQEIGIHIRMGDFKPLPAGGDFKNSGATRTPLKYFINCIIAIREKYQKDLAIKIFSDGFKSELQEILTLNNVNLQKPDLDVIDLIKLSRSKLIITSAHSSFSEWAGFLSDSPIIRHPDHIHGKIRNENELFEGTIEQYLA